MVVSGMKTGTSYVLGRKSIKNENDGVVYSVPKMPRTMVKIYNKDQRILRERMVIDAVNGTGSILGPQPIEPVYESGRFVGYVFHEDICDDTPSVAPVQPTLVKDRTNWTVVTTVCLAVCLVLSLLFFFFGFDLLTADSAAPYVRYNFHGIPMLVSGWLAMLLVLYSMYDRKSNGVFSAVMSLVAFVVGCVVAYAIICLMVAIAIAVLDFINFAMSLVPLLIGGVVLIVLVSALLKSFLK